MGRKSKYNDKIAASIVKLSKKGKTDEEIADIVGISARTFRYWKGKYPEFISDLKDAKLEADSLVEASLYRRATGYYHEEEKIYIIKDKITRVKVMKHYPPDTAAGIFWLKNRQPKVWRDSHVLESTLPPTNDGAIKRTFEEFCEKAGYPKPYPKQVEMCEFGHNPEFGIRLLLGSRGYGKTDYVVILYTAYLIYLNPQYKALLVTKSENRNTAIMSEVEKALVANGVEIEKFNQTTLRVKGIHGKDGNIDALTIGASGIRGRHPNIVLMDDPVTPEDTSQATRKKAKKVYDELAKLCKNILVLGQPVHQLDLFQTLRPVLKNKLEVPYGSIPELDADLEAQRAAGVSEESIQASYFLNVVSEFDMPFTSIKYVDSYPIGPSVAFIDPSFKGGDYTALTILRSHFDGVVVQGYAFKKAWNHCLDEMVQAIREHQVQRVAFEVNSLGDQPVIMLRQALDGLGIGVVGKDSTNNKHSRIMNAGAYAHLIHLSKTSHKTYIDQVVQYEYGAKNDDAPDSLASCLEWVGLIRGKKI